MLLCTATVPGLVNQVVRTALQAAKIAQAQDVTAQPSSSPVVPARVRKKLSRRMSFLSRVTASGVSANKAVTKRRRSANKSALNSLATLNEALALADVEGKHKAERQSRLEGRGACRKRLKITATETVRLQQVLEHPQFQADPFAAIQSHLNATLPDMPKHGERHHGKRTSVRKASK